MRDQARILLEGGRRIIDSQLDYKKLQHGSQAVTGMQQRTELSNVYGACE